MKKIAYLLLLTITTAGYFAGSKILFDKVNDTTQIVIDELFHIPQGKSFCDRNYTHWDSKITTLPGLYLLSSSVLGTYFPCTTYNLRFVNLIASCINLLLFSSILKFVYGGTTDSHFKIVIQALNLTLLPPLYFFSHVYYTDTLSLTFLLGFSRLCIVNKHKMLILALGLCSILMRQTNVLWVAMVFGHKVLDIMIRSSRVFGNKFISQTNLSKKSMIAKDLDNSKLKRYYGLEDLFTAIKYHLTTFFTTFVKFLTTKDWLILIIHTIILSTFAIFVYVNGSIVVGDKKAHTATLHIPQMLYFLLFYGVFALPYVVARLRSTLKLMIANKALVSMIAVAMVIVVHLNTMTHPYLLADNRHYTFYIWNRWFGKYSFAPHATVPLYVFLLFSLYDNIKDQNCISFLLPYTVALFLSLSLQRMIEVRYFLIPYIILRLRFVRPSYKIVISELLLYVLINVATFYVFFTKEIKWTNFDDPQRIIW